MAGSVLVIGGTRFIGRHTVDALVDAGFDVTLFHRGETEPEGLPPVRHLHGDRSAILDHRDAFARIGPDVVVDMVPINRGEAIDTVMTFRGIANRIVAISSQDVYRAYDILRGVDPGPPVPVPLTEDAELRREWYPYRSQVEPDSRLYDYDKIPVEQTYLAEPELPGTILRLPMVYGPDDYQHRPYPYLKRMLDGRPVILVGEAMASWRTSRSFVGNVAAAVVEAVSDDRAAGRVYNVAEPEALTETAWIEAIGGATGWDGEAVVLPEDHLPEHLRLDIEFGQPFVVDTSRIRADLGFSEPIALEEAMRRTIEWEIAHLPDELPPYRFDYAAEDAALPDLTLDL